MPLNASNCWALAGWKCVEAEAKVANAKPQSRGVLMRKAFLEGLSSLPSLTAVSKASARASSKRFLRSTYLPALMALSRRLGDRWEDGIVEGVEGSSGEGLAFVGASGGSDRDRSGASALAVDVLGRGICNHGTSVGVAQKGFQPCMRVPDGDLEGGGHIRSLGA